MVLIAGTSYVVPDIQSERVKSLAQRVRRLRESGAMSPELLGKLRHYFKIKNVYHSNAIEGNTLNIGETRLVVEQGLTLTGRSLKDQAEAKNLAEAIDFLEVLAGSTDQPITESDVRQIHSLVLKGVNDEGSGRYRRVPVEIGGSQFMPPGPESVAVEMNKFGHWIQSASLPGEIFKAEETLLVAAAAHTWFVTIHPFIDGNGRVARLLMNLLLMRYTFPILIISRDDRIRYYDALESSQTGNLGPFVQLLTECMEESLEQYEEITNTSGLTQQETPWVVARAPHKDDPYLHDRYEVWKNVMLLLRSQFRQSVGLLSANIPFSDIDVRDFGIIDPETYQTFLTRVPARWSWFFRLDFQVGHRCVRYLFYFSPRHLDPPGTSAHGITLRVGREDPPDSSQYRGCHLHPAPGDPDILEIDYNSDEEVFQAGGRGQPLRVLKVDTIVREIVQQIVQRNFLTEG